MRINAAILAFLFFSVGPLDSIIADEPNASRADSPAPTREDVDQWIADLSAPEFNRREQATKQLLDAGATVLEPLVSASKECSPEAGIRIAAILRAWYSSDQNDQVDAAEVALEKLSESKNRHIAIRSAATLKQFAGTVGQPRALAQIEKFGGRKVTATTTRMRGLGNDLEPIALMLGTDWKGGEEAVKYLRRVPNLGTLFLAGDRSTGQIKTPGVTQQLIDDLKKTHPWLRVDFRGRAFLGVTAEARQLGCMVEEISPGSPADKGKLRMYDIITQFDGKPVKEFNQLVDTIATKQPGDAVKVEVLRGDSMEIMELENLLTLNKPEDAKRIAELKEQLTKMLTVTLGEWGKALVENREP